jgi:hypothetical protein
MSLLDIGPVSFEVPADYFLEELWCKAVNTIEKIVPQL